MRSAARLNVADILRIREITDVEDAETAKAIFTHRVLDALRAAVDAATQSFAGNEKQIAIHRHVALRSGAQVSLFQYGRRWIGDVPDLVAVVVALNRVVAEESEVGVRDPFELLRGRSLRQQVQIPDGCSGVIGSGAQTDAWIGDWLTRRHVADRGDGARSSGAGRSRASRGEENGNAKSKRAR